MKKIEFKDLPDETTPIDSDNLNLMQNNIEEAIGNSIDLSKSLGNIIVDDIECKNLLNINFQRQTLNGVTFAKNEDGSITLNGTAVKNTELNIDINKNVKADTYSFGITTDYSSIGYDFETGIHIYNNNTLKFNISTARSQRQIDESDVLKSFFIYFKNGATFNNFTIFPQLEKGLISTPYTKHKNFNNDPSLIQVKYLGGPLPYNTQTKLTGIEKVIKIGDRLSVYDDSVKIGKNVHHIKVSVEMDFGNDLSANVEISRNIYIGKNNEILNEFWFKNIAVNTVNYQSYSIPGYIIEVKENDLIYVKVLSTSNDDRVQGNNTHLLVEVID